MRRESRIITGALIAALIGLFLFFYQFFGLKYYLDAVVKLNNIPLISREPATSEFFSKQDGRNTYSGTLAHINQNKNAINGLWVWGVTGLRYLRADNNSLFSFFSICDGGHWRDDSQKISKITTSASEWSSKAKQGNYIKVVIEAGTIQESIVYDWWVFMPTEIVELEKICANR